VQNRKGQTGKVASNTVWSGKETSIGRTQGSGWKIVRNKLREVERLRGITGKCFPESEKQFVGNTMYNKHSPLVAKTQNTA